MNVLFVDQFGELGGAQQCLLDLAPAVLERGWRAWAAVPERGGFAARLKDAGVDVEPICVGEYGFGQKSAGDAIRFLWRMPRLARHLRGLISRNHVDLVYVNGPRVLPAAVLASGKTPVVFHAHNYLAAGVPRRMVNWSVARGEVWTIAVSRYVAGYLRGAVGDGRSHVIPNGVADARRPRELSQPVAPRIGVIGRIAPEKGQLAFVEAARLLPREWRFVVCGGPVLARVEYEREVRARAEGLPVKFLGWRDDVAQVLAGLDLLVVPSNGQEALGRVIVEAFSAETPVVAFASGGIPELITDGCTGFLVEPRTPEALAASIRLILRDDGRRRGVIRAARAAWEAGYTLTHYRERVASVMAQAASIAMPAAVHKTGE